MWFTLICIQDGEEENKVIGDWGVHSCAQDYEVQQRWVIIQVQ